VNSLAEHGYVVLPGVVARSMCDRVVEAIGSELGIWLDDPSSWDRVPTLIDQVPLWGHQSQWDIRQLPALHRLWADIWDTAALWVDMSSCRFTPPWRPGGADAMSIHWDVDPWDEAIRWYPGVLALTDAGQGEGGFRCVPGLTRDRARWPTEWNESEFGVEYRPVFGEDEVIEVPLHAGDLVIMDHHLPHGTVRNHGPSPRVAFYIQYFPEGDSAGREERISDFETGRCPSFWRWKPGHDRTEPEPRASLSGLGRKLLGLNGW
jgi:hypothetical protein